MAPDSKGSPKPKSKTSEPKAKPAPAVQAKAEPGEPKSLIWLGPVIRRPGLYINQAQTFRGLDKVPREFRELIADDPDATSLLVPVAKAGLVLAEIKAGGNAPAARAFEQTAERYKRVIPGREGGN